MKPRFQGRQKEVTLLICTGRQLLEVPLKAWWRQDRIGFIFAGQGKGKVRSVRSKLAQFFNWRVMSVTYTDGVGWSMSSDCTRRQEHEGKPEGKELNRVLAS